MTVQEFEDKVWEVEGIRIVIRANTKDSVTAYNYQNAAQETWRVTQWLKNRIRPKLRNKQVALVEGNGEEPHGRTILRTLRKSYSRA